MNFIRRTMLPLLHGLEDLARLAQEYLFQPMVPAEALVCDHSRRLFLDKHADVVDSCLIHPSIVPTEKWYPLHWRPIPSTLTACQEILLYVQIPKDMSEPTIFQMDCVPIERYKQIGIRFQG